MRLTSLIAFSALALVACRGGDDDGNNNGNPDGGGSGSGSGGFVKIQDVQNDSMSPGTAVSLHNVVVTAIDNFGDKKGDIWVEEQGGGKRSGVHVYNAQLTDVATLQVGDVIDLKGAIKSEFALTGSGGDTTGRTVTELEPASGGQITITKSGMSSPITPDKVDALAIGQLYDSTVADHSGGQAFSNAWEDWEGVLIELDNVSALGAPAGFGSKPYAADAYALNMTGVIKLEGTQTDITMSNITRTTCFSKTVGVVDYFFSYLLLPRSSADFATGGTSCPAAESVCNDSKDNDGNGFTDCADNGCVIGDASCRMATTIAAIDALGDANPTAPVLPSGGISIANACVVAISGTNMYVSAADTGAADGGIYVFGGGQALPAGTVKGSTVDVIGTLSAFKSSSTSPEPQVEISALQVTKDAATCNPTPGTPALTAAQLTTDATGHPWIGSYVTITKANGGQFKIATAQSAQSKFGTLTQGSTTFAFGSTFLSAFDPNPVGTCYGSITGIWTFDTVSGKYEILPLVQPTVETCTN